MLLRNLPEAGVQVKEAQVPHRARGGALGCGRGLAGGGQAGGALGPNGGGVLGGAVLQSALLQGSFVGAAEAVVIDDLRRKGGVWSAPTNSHGRVLATSQ
jgi:hypothetical protein